MATLREHCQTLSRQLGSLSAAPELEAERWLCRTLGWSRSQLYARWDEAPDFELDAAQWARRLGGEPLAYVWGEVEFWGLSLRVDERVLIPRPDTECLIEAALDRASGLPPRAEVLDLGTGSGAIALALASEKPSWRITATERSPEALRVARENGRRLRLRLAFAEANWFDGLPASQWDLIVSNPPYIADNDPHLAQLQHEPAQALVASGDGLGDLLAIIEGARSRLRSGGCLQLEHGHDQGNRVRQALRDAGFVNIDTRRDHGGNERSSGGRWP